MASPKTSSSDPATWRHKSVSEMTEEERLASLKEWAEEKKYVTPGEQGTMNISQGGIGGPSFSIARPSAQQPDSNDKYAGQYDAPVGPPSYTPDAPTHERKKSAVGRWLEKRKEKKEEKRRRESAPEYAP